uniref:Forkhead box O6 n=1 Tax=Latimeria chalumnae TaxID=7897 RepID=H3B652_LATCH
NSIRHNLSLHTRFIRVQNEGAGKSSWWMLNPEGGKTGKTPRRRAVSMDNNSKFLKSKGRVGKKKAALRAAQERADDSPSSQCTKWSGSPTSHASDEVDVWADFRTRTNSSASTMSARLSPIMANSELDDLEDDDRTPSSPLMYPSPSSTVSPSANTRCSVELPRLADLTGTISLNEGLPESLLDELQDGYSTSPSQQLPPGGLRQRSSSFSFNSKCSTLGASTNTYCGTIYSQPAMTMMRRSPMQTIQENKQATFPPIHSYGNATLHDVLSSNSFAQKVVTSRNHRQNAIMCSGDDRGLGNALYHPSPANQNPAINSALPNPISLMGMSHDTCNLAAISHQGHLQPYIHPRTHMSIAESGFASYQAGITPMVPGHDKFPADLDLDIFNGSLECDVESIILNDFMDNDEMDFNFDCALLPQNGLNMSALQNAPQTSNQSWVPG